MCGNIMEKDPDMKNLFFFEFFIEPALPQICQTAFTLIIYVANGAGDLL